MKTSFLRKLALMLGLTLAAALINVPLALGLLAAGGLLFIMQLDYAKRRRGSFGWAA